jgi:hypothetical protein
LDTAVWLRKDGSWSREKPGYGNGFSPYFPLVASPTILSLEELKGLILGFDS